MRRLHITPGVFARPARHRAELLDHFELRTIDVALGKLLVDTRVGGDDRRNLVNDRLDAVFTSQSLVK